MAAAGAQMPWNFVPVTQEKAQPLKGARQSNRPLINLRVADLWLEEATQLSQPLWPQFGSQVLATDFKYGGSQPEQVQPDWASDCGENSIFEDLLPGKTEVGIDLTSHFRSFTVIISCLKNYGLTKGCVLQGVLSPEAQLMNDDFHAFCNSLLDGNW